MRELDALRAASSLTDRFRPRNLRRDGHGTPVMYDTPVRPDGTPAQPDWRVRWRAATWRLCWLCGDGLGREQAFITTPEHAHSGRLRTPGLHVDCARFCLLAVPRFAHPDTELVVLVAAAARPLRSWWWRTLLTVGRDLEAAPIVTVTGVSQRETHTGAASMAALLAEHGGCPAHAEMGASGCLEHAELLTVGERERVRRRSASERKLTARG